MPTLDLNAEAKVRAAQREKDGKDPIVVRYKDLKITLPDEMPMEFSFLAGENKLKEAFAIVFGEHNDTFWSYMPSTADTKRLSEWLAEAYGFADEGESSPSVGT